MRQRLSDPDGVVHIATEDSDQYMKMTFCEKPQGYARDVWKMAELSFCAGLVTCMMCATRWWRRWG